MFPLNKMSGNPSNENVYITIGYAREENQFQFTEIH